MAASAQILRDHKTQLTSDERVKEFLDIIRSLGYETEAESGSSIYIMQNSNDEKGVRVWVDQEDYWIFSINGKEYYREVFFDFIWDDKRHGIESMNSDMILAIAAEYMKKYPDALFHYEGCNDDNMFLDKADIENILNQPFVPGWFWLFKSHRNSSRVNEDYDDWTLE